MRAWLVSVIGLLGCGGGATADDTGGEPQGIVKIDGTGSVTVRDQSNSELPSSPFTCGGGNCGGSEVVSMTHSITFTAVPTTGFKLTGATIELGSASPSPVTAGTAISVDPEIGWTLAVVFDPI